MFSDQIFLHQASLFWYAEFLVFSWAGFLHQPTLALHHASRIFCCQAYMTITSEPVLLKGFGTTIGFQSRSSFQVAWLVFAQARLPLFSHGRRYGFSFLFVLFLFSFLLVLIVMMVMLLYFLWKFLFYVCRDDFVGMFYTSRYWWP